MKDIFTPESQKEGEGECKVGYLAASLVGGVDVLPGRASVIRGSAEGRKSV